MSCTSSRRVNPHRYVGLRRRLDSNQQSGWTDDSLAKSFLTIRLYSTYALWDGTSDEIRTRVIPVTGEDTGPLEDGSIWRVVKDLNSQSMVWSHLVCR